MQCGKPVAVAFTLSVGGYKILNIINISVSLGQKQNGNNNRMESIHEIASMRLANCSLQSLWRQVMDYDIHIVSLGQCTKCTSARNKQVTNKNRSQFISIMQISDYSLLQNRLHRVCQLP